MSKSICSLVRRHVKVKGRSWHSGRGFYVCEAEGVTQPELYDKIKSKVGEWAERGLIKHSTVTDEFVEVEFINNDEQYGHYSNLRVDKAANRCFCLNAKWMVRVSR